MKLAELEEDNIVSEKLREKIREYKERTKNVKMEKMRISKTTVICFPKGKYSKKDKEMLKNKYNL